MPTYRVTCCRADTYIAEISVDAETEEEAREKIEEQLDEGWEEVFGDEDGDLDDSNHWVERVERVAAKDPDSKGAAPCGD